MAAVSQWYFDPEQPELPYLPVETLPAKARWHGLITSQVPYTPHTHWIAGRTLPCMGDGCEACGQQRPRRKEGFIGFGLLPQRKHIILRLTEHVAITLLRHKADVETLRGVHLKLERRGARSNGFVQVELDPANYETPRLPVAPVLEMHLSRVWRLDGWEPAVELQGYAEQLAKHLRLLKGGDDANAVA